MTDIERGQLSSFSSLPAISLFGETVQRYYIDYWSVDAHKKLQLISGSVSIPSSAISEPLHLLVYNHGTVTKKEWVPSNPNDPYGHSYSLFFTGLHKYITIMTDYIGYGISADLPHCYCMAEPLGYNAMDSLLATLKLLNKLKIKYKVNTKDIHLSGYSEGGIATMGLLRILETEYNEQFNVASCSPGASPFFNDIKYTILNPGHYTSTLSTYYFLCMQRIYGVFNSLSDVLNTKYVNIDVVKNALFSGKLHYTEISEKLPKDLKLLFNDRYLKGIMNDTLQKDKLFFKFIGKAKSLSMFLFGYKFKSIINYVGAGGDLEVPWKVNEKFINENKKKLYPNLEVVDVGNMLDHSNEGKFLVLNMQSFYMNKARKTINSQRNGQIKAKL